MEAFIYLRPFRIRYCMADKASSVWHRFYFIYILPANTIAPFGFLAPILGSYLVHLLTGVSSALTRLSCTHLSSCLVQYLLSASGEYRRLCCTPLGLIPNKRGRQYGSGESPCARFNWLSFAGEPMVRAPLVEDAK